MTTSDPDRPLLTVFQDGVLHGWDCEVHGHAYERDNPACVSCGETTQMTFADVVEYELLPGDAEYTLWLKIGRPQLTGDELASFRRLPRKPIEDVLPGL